MENRNSSLWIGLGIGTVIGTLAYRFSRTSKAKKLKEKVCDTFHKITGQAEDMLDEAKEKAVGLWFAGWIWLSGWFLCRWWGEL